VSQLALPGSESATGIYSSLSDGHWQLAPGPGPQRTKSPSWLCLFVSCQCSLLLATIAVGPWGLFHWHLALPLPVPSESTTSSSDRSAGSGPGAAAAGSSQWATHRVVPVTVTGRWAPTKCKPADIRRQHWHCGGSTGTEVSLSALRTDSERTRRDPGTDPGPLRGPTLNATRGAPGRRKAGQDGPPFSWPRSEMISVPLFRTLKEL
jgi:hypothetical protein